MFAGLAVLSIVGGSCIACTATGSRFERRLDYFSGVLVVYGFTTIGSMLAPFVR